MENKDITDFEVVWDLWSFNAQTTPDKDAIVHWRAGEEPYRWSFKELVDTAEKIAYQLFLRGIRKDEVCALIIKHNKYFYPIYMAVSRLGAIPAVLAYPNPRLHPDKFRQGIEGMSLRSGLDWILTEKSIEEIISPLIDKSKTSIRGLHFPLEWDYIDVPEEFTMYLNEVRRSITKDSPFLLQHSSGTTGLQKPVLLSHKAVIKHVKNYADSINLNKEDKIVSWLPLYHDMGLIAAYHLPLAYGITQVQIDTFEWIVIPSLMIEVAHKEKGTVSWLPNFAYNLMADKIQDEDLEGLSLESMRMIINCSEPVRDESHQKFNRHFSRFGLKENVLSTCYAMAETTFAVSQSSPDEQMAKVKADRQELANGALRIVDGEESNYRICVSSGKLIKDCMVKIVNEYNEELPEGYVGEITIQSVSMFDGYRNYPEKTAEALKDNWYYSGDFGFFYQDELYVIGRKKDLIISAGNNVFPEDVEDQINKVEGVIPGRVVAFGEYDEILGSETVSVIVETSVDAADQKALKLRIVKQAMLMDISIKKVYLVPPRWLIKSSAGKPSRKANKERILNNEESLAELPQN